MKLQVETIVTDQANRQRILDALERAEIKAIFEDQKAMLGYGYKGHIKRLLANHFNRSIKSIESIVYH